MTDLLQTHTLQKRLQWKFARALGVEPVVSYSSSLLNEFTM